jgi:hypothetical protein
LYAAVVVDEKERDEAAARRIGTVSVRAMRRYSSRVLTPYLRNLSASLIGLYSISRAIRSARLLH